MLTKSINTATANRLGKLKQFDFHELCIKFAVNVSIVVGTVKFIWGEIKWVVEAVLALIR